MMAEPSTSVSLGARSQRLKFALISVLALTLILALLWPSGDDAQPPADSETAESGQQQSAESETDNDNKDHGAGPTSAAFQRAQKPWPAMSLTSILQHDPFELPSVLAARTLAAASQQNHDSETTVPAEEHVNLLMDRIATMRQKQVSVLFRSPKGTAAIVDSKVVHEGDLLEEGVRVVEIHPDGVVVQIQNR